MESISIVGIVLAICFVVLGPLVGGIIIGIDRKISAHMQRRVGPPIMQPIYDVMKLFGKERATVTGSQDVYIAMHLFFVVVAGALFFLGGNFLLVILLVTMGSLFLIMAAYSSRSPFAEAGAQRENLQVMAYEPMTLLTAAGFFMTTGTFNVADIASEPVPAVLSLPLIFIGFLFILTIKLRKSPFDLSSSEHAHQELVRGVSTELSGRTMALYEMAHWYETVLFLGWTGLFIVWNGPVGIIITLVVLAVLYFIEILIDNNFARVKWQAALKTSWWVALILGGVNILFLQLGLIPDTQTLAQVISTMM